MTTYPVSIRADRSAPPGRWLWLVKWLLLIPHYVVLAVLWVAFVALTAVAYVVVLVTGRYPAAIHEFNAGVLRWTWRVGFYGYTMLGTDRYPPFTLAERPDYPAGLTIDAPPRLPRWLPLAAWLLALPHLLIVAALVGGAWRVTPDRGDDVVTLSTTMVAVLVAAIALLFTGRYPPGLYDLLAGTARWWLRVVAYLALLTGAYPPLRLDQGEREPDPDPDPDRGPAAPVPTGSPPRATAVAHTAGGGRAAAVVSLLAGVLLFLLGGGIATAGGVLLGLNAERADGFVSSATMSTSTRTAAITVEGLRVDPAGRWALDVVGVDRVRLTVTSDQSVFLGVARESDVDRWLGTAGHDELVQPAAGTGSGLRRSGGAVRDLSRPGDQSFWVGSTAGSGPITLDWSVAEGTYAVVLANVDGSVGVTADVRAGASLPNLAPIGFTLLGVGILITLVGLALVYAGAAGLGSAPRTGPPTAPPPAPAEPAPRPHAPVAV